MSETPIQVQCPICGILHDEGPERGIYGVICKDCRDRIERRIIIECPYDVNKCVFYRQLISSVVEKAQSDMHEGKGYAGAECGL